MQHSVHFIEANLDQIVLHKVGNKSREEGIKIAKSPLQLDEEAKEILKAYFLSSFQTETFYQFYHDNDLNMNEVYTYANYIFQDDADFYDQSINILRHLYEKSTHNKVQEGELYVVRFHDCIFDDELVDAIGIFKTETKDKFLKLSAHIDMQADGAEGDYAEWKLSFDEGTNLARLDKGCLILNTLEDNGYRVLTVDVKSSDARYWLEDFLHVVQVQDDAFLTKNSLDLCKDFGKKVLAKEDKEKQVSFMNKSLEYFETKEEFDYNEFVQDVFAGEDEMIDKFQEHKKAYNKKQGVAVKDVFDEASFEEEDMNFFIAPNAVKRAKKSFKNSIQLDTEMEIKIQSAQVQENGFLEKCYDEDRQMYYYKVYFNEEK